MYDDIGCFVEPSAAPLSSVICRSLCMWFRTDERLERSGLASLPTLECEKYALPVLGFRVRANASLRTRKQRRYCSVRGTAMNPTKLVQRAITAGSHVFIGHFPLS